eukprot:1329910-Rhodomonas_salina.5
MQTIAPPGRCSRALSRAQRMPRCTNLPVSMRHRVWFSRGACCSRPAHLPRTDIACGAISSHMSQSVVQLQARSW